MGSGIFERNRDEIDITRGHGCVEWDLCDDRKLSDAEELNNTVSMAYPSTSSNRTCRYARYHTLSITKWHCSQSNNPPVFEDLRRQLASCETASYSLPNTVLHIWFRFPDTTPPWAWSIRPKGPTYSGWSRSCHQSWFSHKPSPKAKRSGLWENIALKCEYRRSSFKAFNERTCVKLIVSLRFQTTNLSFILLWYLLDPVHANRSGNDEHHHLVYEYRGIGHHRLAGKGWYPEYWEYLKAKHTAPLAPSSWDASHDVAVLVPSPPPPPPGISSVAAESLMMKSSSSSSNLSSGGPERLLSERAGFMKSLLVGNPIPHLNHRLGSCGENNG